jgi:hypothetical protein
MSGEGLVELARRYVALSDQLEVVRGEIAKAVLNGAGDAPHPPIPSGVSLRGSSRTSGGMNPRAIAAANAEAAIIEALQSSPGMGTAGVARATNAKVNSTTERLRRLKQKGQVERSEGGGWQASAAPG